MEETVQAAIDAARAARAEMESALHNLEHTIASPMAAPDWNSEVLDRLADLGSALDSHIREVEGPDGLLEEIVEVSPRLSNHVERMRQDHDRIAERLAEAKRAVGTVEGGEVRSLVLELIHDLTLHRHRGSDLVYEAYATDIGGQGGG